MRDDQVCMRQAFRPRQHHHLDGCGNCMTCTRHPDNEDCNMFFAITMPSEITINEVEHIMRDV
jgi:hypothetical protein